MEPTRYKENFMLATGVGVCTAVLYLAGFWGSFHFNAWEYFSFADLTSHTILPLLVGVAPVIIGMALSNLTTGDIFPPGGGADTSIGKFGRKHWRWLFLALAILIGCVLLFAPYEIKLTVTPLFLSVFAIPLGGNKILIDLMPNDRFRHAVISLSVLIPAYAFCAGNLEANIFKSGYGKYQVDLARTKISFQADENHRVIYIGYLSGSFIFYEQQSAGIVVVKQKDDVPIFLKPFSKHI